MRTFCKTLWIAALTVTCGGALAQYDGEPGSSAYPESGYAPSEMAPSMEQYGEPDTGTSYRDQERWRDQGPQGPMRTDQVVTRKASGEAYLDCQDSIRCQQRNPSWPDQPWWSYRGPQTITQHGNVRAE